MAKTEKGKKIVSVPAHTRNGVVTFTRTQF